MLTDTDRIPMLPAKLAWWQINRRNEKMAMMALMRTEELKQALSDAEHGNPGTLMQILPQFMTMLQQGVHETPSSEHDLREKSLHASAYQNVGVFLQWLDPEKKNFKLWDFEALLSMAVGVLYVDGYIVIEMAEEQIRFDADVSAAFMRYLHFLGVFEVDALKQVCPECMARRLHGFVVAGAPVEAGGALPDCTRCGGLGWIIPQPEDELRVVEQ
jgi:hypothetical protein